MLLGLQLVGRHVQLPNPVLIAVPAAPAPQRAVSQQSPREMETLEGAKVKAVAARESLVSFCAQVSAAFFKEALSLLRCMCFIFTAARGRASVGERKGRRTCSMP